ncbi:sensor histidine kinase [Streptosporangium amethystogenes]|uniref:sensor histidine kinase n=1 Tax=Streptosporangium amethystogenes TaxID=2002 RepID=UPI00068CD16B|nr:sensor histidine kinase [Streptosporangium amethystogenes]
MTSSNLLLERKIGPVPVLDATVGVGLALWAVGSAWRDGGMSMPFLLLATLPLAFRRVNPPAALVATFVGGVGLLLNGVNPLSNLAIATSAALALYTLLRPLPRAQAWRVTVMVLAGLFMLGLSLVLTGRGELALTVVPMIAFCVGGIALLVDLARARGEVKEVRQESVEQMITAQREQAAMAERARIAREMHDIVAHSISRIAVEAETAPYTIKDLSDPAREGFEQIATTARETLVEMRRLLGVLRTDGGAGGTSPQPGLARVPELLEEHRKAGGTVDLDIIGDAVPLPAAVDLSAYRILQEALTNARSHAPDANVRIELAYLQDTLAIRVSDDGPGPSPNAGGHGLVGMRERVVMLGGWLNTGTAPEGGFLIEAGLPLTRVEAAA